MTFPKKLRLQGWEPKLEGTGQRLTLLFSFGRGQNKWEKAGTAHVEVDRWFIAALCRQIHAMQNVDRARIREELKRLEDEVAPLQRTPTPKE